MQDRGWEVPSCSSFGPFIYLGIGCILSRPNLQLPFGWGRLKSTAGKHAIITSDIYNLSFKSILHNNHSIPANITTFRLEVLGFESTRRWVNFPNWQLPAGIYPSLKMMRFAFPLIICVKRCNTLLNNSGDFDQPHLVHQMNKNFVQGSHVCV